MRRYEDVNEWVFWDEKGSVMKCSTCGHSKLEHEELAGGGRGKCLTCERTRNLIARCVLFRTAVREQEQSWQAAERVMAALKEGLVVESHMERRDINITLAKDRENVYLLGDLIVTFKIKDNPISFAIGEIVRVNHLCIPLEGRYGKIEDRTFAVGSKTVVDHYSVRFNDGQRFNVFAVAVEKVP